MKSTFTTAALSGLLLSLATVTSVQAIDAGQPPGLLLAENGSEHLGEFHMLREQRIQARENADQQFIQMIEEEPSAAGQQYPSEESQPLKQQAPQYRLPIHQQRIEYGH
ncbi:hypothetical protein D3880_17590 [Pseudomonas cavernae]|uniref:DUF4148 domain-containing protein n=1 Tax=Pseudomonas cavernae TaxID=2320867 RepID=A0A385Z8W9_9PSED|nr:hypothetical protein [Pseudomonas cavernae]AYC34062.1 hypothetical protein D3880_17590 [Pseudomonas cavernae]